MMKKGFTIVELLMVIGIIAVLMGIVTTAASESLKSSRKRRAEAVMALVQSGLAAYYAQNDEWPISFRGKVGNHKISGNDIDENQYDLESNEVRECVRKIVESAKEGNPLIDVSGLWVSRSDGDSGTRAVGMDFLSAIHGTKKSGRKMKLAEMYFGYPDENTGAFIRFGMGYSIAGDQLRVGYRSDFKGNK